MSQLQNAVRARVSGSDKLHLQDFNWAGSYLGNIATRWKNSRIEIKNWSPTKVQRRQHIMPLFFLYILRRHIFLFAYLLSSGLKLAIFRAHWASLKLPLLAPRPQSQGFIRLSPVQPKALEICQKYTAMLFKHLAVWGCLSVSYWVCSIIFLFMLWN